MGVGLLELFGEGNFADERTDSDSVGGPGSESWFFGDGLVGNLLEGFFLEYGQVEVIGVFFVLAVPVFQVVLGLSEEVGEGAGAFCLISHLTNIILF